ncbi:MAG TPA: DoxX family protein [Pyrinomonadaceae bacterium]|nr:DoxX family protein [Pyrinomonadaceae bacterium]
MESEKTNIGVSKTARWAGYILSGIASLFLLADAIGKFVRPDVVVKGTIELGYNESVIFPLGLMLLVSTLLYIWPRTAVIGAILLTGYLGGAVATHVRIGNPLLTHILFPVYLGVILWAGIYFRDMRVRDLIPLRNMPN